jgi:DNA-directed RNA polymerase subunit RPC12/RpoP
LKHSATQLRLAYVEFQLHIAAMRKGDVQCPECGAGYRRIEVISMKGQAGEYRCLTCGHRLEEFSGQTYVAYRLTVQPAKVFRD